MRVCFTLLILLAILAAPTIAQRDEDECPGVIYTALEAIDAFCTETDRNQVCYGNPILEATMRGDDVTASFSEQGDVADVMLIETLRSGSLDLENEEWGVALMRLQANLPDTLPGQSVNVLLFGDTTVQRSATDADEATVMSIQPASDLNVRRGPSTDYAVIGGLVSGDEVLATGRNEDATWLQITQDNGDFTGWVFTQLVEVEDDPLQLPVVGADDAQSPMQAFYFSTGISDAICNDMPNSGLLIQTPGGEFEVTLEANEVTINLASTAFLQAVPGDEMQINVLKGRLEIAAFDVEQVALAGTRVRVPIDEQLSASGPPTNPEPCEVNDLRGLPADFGECQWVEMHLPTECPGVVPLGMDLLFTIPGDAATTQTEADALVESSLATILIDDIPVDFEEQTYETGDEAEPFGHDINFYWEEPGLATYVVSGTVHEGESFECIVEVIEPSAE